MGWMDNMRTAFSRPRIDDHGKNMDIVGAQKNDGDGALCMTFNDRNITYTGELTN